MTGYYLEVILPETKKLLGTTKSNITKDEQVIRAEEGQDF